MRAPRSKPCRCSGETVALEGQAKTDYQREYMRKRRGSLKSAREGARTRVASERASLAQEGERVWANGPEFEREPPKIARLMMDYSSSPDRDRWRTAQYFAYLAARRSLLPPLRERKRRSAEYGQMRQAPIRALEAEILPIFLARTPQRYARTRADSERERKHLAELQARAFVASYVVPDDLPNPRKPEYILGWRLKVLRFVVLAVELGVSLKPRLPLRAPDRQAPKGRGIGSLAGIDFVERFRYVCDNLYGGWCPRDRNEYEYSTDDPSKWGESHQHLRVGNDLSLTREPQTPVVPLSEDRGETGLYRESVAPTASVTPAV